MSAINQLDFFSCLTEIRLSLRLIKKGLIKIFNSITNMKKIYFIVILGVLSLTYSCTYNELVTDELPPVEGPISFSGDIQPIFDGKCVACHGSSGGLGLESDNSYANIVPDRVNLDVPVESLIYAKALPTGSHPSKYNATEAQLVLTWIEQGAENN